MATAGHGVCSHDFEAPDDGDSDWDAAFQSEQLLSQQESEEVESACGARSESGSESDSEQSRTKLPCWWARVLFRAVKDMGHQWPHATEKPLQVVSGCTGCSAEASVLKV